MMRRLILPILAVLVMTIMVPIAMHAAIAPFMYDTVAEVPQSQVALVLGASVVRGVPSPVLARRADAAIALYKAGKVSKILVTGDNGALSHDEVTPVRKYLTDAGIPPQDIFLDHAGFDTYSSLYRARDVFYADSITIVTQDFHLPRALWIARHLGITAYGLTAEGGTRYLYNYVREIPASIKSLFDLNLGREPKYLGPTIPLTGTGTTTWY